jgi:glutathione S-transferase
LISFKYGQPIRLLLAHTGIEFEDKLYAWQGDNFDAGEWLADKHNLGLEFPNVSLPFN